MVLVQRILDRLAKHGSAKASGPVRVSNATRQVELAYRVDVADNGRKRRKGLLGRESLAAGEGMWIVPCEAVHTLGMRFAIDLVYLDRNNMVMKIRHGVPPWRMSACFSAHSVLELASGSVRRTGTMPGDRLEITLQGSQVLQTPACDRTNYKRK